MRKLAFVLGGIGLAIVTSSAVVAFGSRSPAIRSYATASPGFAVIASLTGAALFAAAAFVAAEGGNVWTALATFGLGVTWSADLWAGWPAAPTLLRTAGMLLVPMLAPATLLAVAGLLATHWPVRASIAVSTAAIAAATVLWLVRDPFLDRYCWRDCLAHPLAPFSGVALARSATHVSLATGAACGAAAVALGVASLVRSRRRVPLLAGLAAGSAVLASDFVLRLEPAENPSRPIFAALFVIRGLTLLGLAVALGYLAMRPRLVRHALSRLASVQGDLAVALADALDDPKLRIGYPVADGPTLDAGGRPTHFERTPARIVRRGELVALVGSAAGAPPAAALEAALGPAARLALANERLRAEKLFRLDELTALRQRIVSIADAARQRLERDLHDGAQQRLLALGIDLRVALKQADVVGRDETVELLRNAAARVAEATEELRNVAHGIFPATLANAGLAAALETLADSRPLVLSIHLETGRRYPAELETAAYAIVSEASAGVSDPVRVRVAERTGSLVVTLDGTAPTAGVASAEDRVSAVGGTVRWTGRRLEAVLPLPEPDEHGRS
jgi:signal transduction histidine kinase